MNSKNTPLSSSVLVTIAGLLIVFIALWQSQEAPQPTKLATSIAAHTANSADESNEEIASLYSPLIREFKNVQFEIQKNANSHSLELAKLNDRLDQLEAWQLSLANTDLVLSKGLQVQDKEEYAEQPEYQYTEQEKQMVLDMAVAQTGADEIWEQQTVDNLQRLFVETPELGIAKQVDTICGNNICKVDMVFPKGVSYEERSLLQLIFLTELATQLPRTKIVEKTLADGSIKEVYYMARNGHNLPTEGPVVEDLEEDRRDAGNL